jgi:group I intron endonuclease
MSKIVSGIYVILNTRNNKVYIGQAVDFRTRWFTHQSALIHNRHKNRHLQAAWNKYGAKAFKFQRLEYCLAEQLDEREQHYLDVYMVKGICYNLAKDVQASMRGKHHSAETRRKISEAGKNVSAETRHKRSVAKRNISDDGRRRMSEPNKGKQVSAETRQKMSEAHKGKKHSKSHVLNEEVRRNMSESQHRRREHEKKIKAASDQQAAANGTGL